MIYLVCFPFIGGAKIINILKHQTIYLKNIALGMKVNEEYILRFTIYGLRSASSGGFTVYGLKFKTHNQK